MQVSSDVKNMTILLIQPEESTMASKIMNVFEEKEFTMIHVHDIEEGYNVLGMQSVDIIILDMDEDYDAAFKFCFKVKKNKNLDHILLVGLSAAHERYGIYLTAQTAGEKKWLNLDVFLHKPISARTLYRVLKREIAIIEGIDATKLDTDADFEF